MRLAILLGTAALAFAQSDVLTFHNDNARTGQYLAETTLTHANVNSATFGKLFTVPMDGKVDGQPLYVANLDMPGKGRHNVVYAVTEHDSVYAFGALTGTVLWHASLLKPGEQPSDPRGCDQVVPEIGFTSTPVIDRSAGPHGTIYVVAMSKGLAGKYHQRLHALDLATGAEQFRGPVDIAATFPGTGDTSVNGNVVFTPGQHKERAALLLSGGIVYTSWSSHCDIRPYNGWTIGYDRLSLARRGVFNFAPNGDGAAVWSSGGGPAAGSSGALFFPLANGTFDTVRDVRGFPNHGNYGNAIVKLRPNGGLMITDYWTMFDSLSESSFDWDLGSGGIVLLPDMKDAGGKVRALGVSGGKDQHLYVFDRNDIGKYDPQSNRTLYQDLPGVVAGGMFSTPAWFNGTVYVGAVKDTIRAFRVQQARLANAPSSVTPTVFGYPGATPSISAHGTRDPILWAVEHDTLAVLHAYNANSLGHELYNSDQAPAGRDHFGGGNKFMVPTIANGHVYVGTPNGVAVFGLRK